MKEYNHLSIEQKWAKEWAKKKAYKTDAFSAKNAKKKKKYVLDMFPYPSGAGLHVGHPKGYIGSDVYARMKRMEGYNVLHPMGYDAFGLPAEQYAVEHNMSPKKAVEENIKTFERQLSIMGLSYDWDRKVNTTDPAYYRWTQWIFLKLYGSWYNEAKNTAEPIETLIKKFEKDKTWKTKSEKEKQAELMKYRLAYEGFAEVNWCPQLGTVLANDEVLDGPDGTLVSERGGFPVEKKNMRQWFMRITAYADRLLSGLDTLDWPEHIKEIERNWIGKSEGAEIGFDIVFENGGQPGRIPVFTTRPDTLFGVTYIVLAPDHLWVTLATDDNHIGVLKNRDEVKKYIADAKARAVAGEKKDGKNGKENAKNDTNRSKEKTGVRLEGVMAINPANGEKVPVFVADYVLASYGTGAVMAVPAHDERDFEFATKYHLPIRQVIARHIIDKKYPPAAGQKSVARQTIHAIVRNPKTGKYLCLEWKKFPWTTFIVGGVEDGEDAIDAAKREVYEETGFKNITLTKRLTNIVCTEYNAAHKKENRIAYTTGLFFDLENEERDEIEAEEREKHDFVWLDRNEITEQRMTCAELPVWLENFDGTEKPYLDRGVLINSGKFSGVDSEAAKKEITKFIGAQTVTQYKMRDAIFARQRYWGEPIPLWYDKEGIIHEVPENKLPLKLPEVQSFKPTGTGESPLAAVPAWTKKGYETNTMPGWAGSSWYFLRYMDPKNTKRFADKKAIDYWKNVDVYVGGAEHATGHLLYARFWHKFLKDMKLVPTEEPFQRLKNQGLILGTDNRKMSKRWGNVVNPDDIVKTYGADTLRVYEMFMGPFEASLPWSTDNIIGSRRFVERVWRLADKMELRKGKKIKKNSKFEAVLHKTIKKVTEDIETFSFNTAVSAMMILVNECEKMEVIERVNFELFLKILSPFAPHVTEEIWHTFGNKTLLVTEKWPKANAAKMKESQISVVIQINGKMRAMCEVAADAIEKEILAQAQELPAVDKWLAGHEIQKVIYIPGKVMNIVLR